MNPEKFKSAYGFPAFPSLFAAYDSRYLTVGAMDALAGTTSNGKKRAVSYFQVAGVSPATGMAVVTGNYPTSSGSVSGLIRDSKSASSTEALTDGAQA